MEQERCGPRQLGGIVVKFVIENGQPVLQRLPETLLFPRHHADYEVTVLNDVGIRITHHPDRYFSQPRHHHFLCPE